MSARGDAPFGPTLARVKLANQQQPTAGRCRQMGGERTDLALQGLERFQLGSQRLPGPGGRGWIRIHDRTHVRIVVVGPDGLEAGGKSRIDS